MEQYLQVIKAVKLVILDVDGVLTDGSLFIDNRGGEYKAFNSKDGHGIRMLQDGGIEVAIITARQSELVQHRADNLKIPAENVYQGYRDKRQALSDLLERTGLDASQVAYVGDDVIDLPVMSRVGLAIAVNDAHDFVRQQAHWITERPGGRGAVREISDAILRIQDKLDSLHQAYLNV